MVKEAHALKEGKHRPLLHLSPAEHRRVPAGVHRSSLPAQAPTFPSWGQQVIGKMVCMCHTTGAESEYRQSMMSKEAGTWKVCLRWPGEH